VVTGFWPVQARRRERPTTSDQRLMFIDSHAHLEGKRYDADRDEVLRRAKQNGIDAY